MASYGCQLPTHHRDLGGELLVSLPVLVSFDFSKNFLAFFGRFLPQGKQKTKKYTVCWRVLVVLGSLVMAMWEGRGLLEAS